MVDAPVESAVTTWSSQPNYYIGNPPTDGALGTNDLDAPGYREASVAMIRAAGPAVRESRNALEAEDLTLAEKHDLVQTALATVPTSSPEASWFATVTVSLLAVDAFTRDRAEPEVVAVYVENLLNAENPNADVMLRGLQALDGHWEPQRLKTAARQAADAALTFLGTDCDECRAAEQALQPEDRADAITDAVGMLEHIAGE